MLSSTMRIKNLYSKLIARVTSGRPPSMKFTLTNLLFLSGQAYKILSKGSNVSVSSAKTLVSQADEKLINTLYGSPEPVTVSSGDSDSDLELLNAQTQRASNNKSPRTDAGDDNGRTTSDNVGGASRSDAKPTASGPKSASSSKPKSRSEENRRVAIIKSGFDFVLFGFDSNPYLPK